MNQVIIYTNQNGGVSVCIPTGEVPIEDVQTKDIPTGVQSFIVESSTLPTQDDDFFNAWEQTDGVVTVSLAKAREITKQRLRVEREPLLVEQDVLYMRAIEQGSDTAAIVAEKVRLRDITTLADAASTTAELRLLKV